MILNNLVCMYVYMYVCMYYVGLYVLCKDTISSVKAKPSQKSRAI